MKSDKKRILDLVHIEEAAEEFGIHRSTLYRYIKQGRVTAYKSGIGNETFVDRAQMTNLAAPRPVPPARKN